MNMLTRLTTHRRSTRKGKGFTLLELIVVLVILGILALIAIPTFQSVINGSRQGAVMTTAHSIARNANGQAALGGPTQQPTLSQVQTAANETPGLTYANQGTQGIQITEASAIAYVCLNGSQAVAQSNACVDWPAEASAILVAGGVGGYACTNYSTAIAAWNSDSVQVCTGAGFSPPYGTGGPTHGSETDTINQGNWGVAVDAPAGQSSYCSPYGCAVLVHYRSDGNIEAARATVGQSEQTWTGSCSSPDLLRAFQASAAPDPC